MKTTDKPVIVEQIFHTASEKVWLAITGLKHMKHWFFENIPSFQAVEGFETQFNIQSGDRNFFHLWKLTEVVPMRKITYNWKYEGYAGDSNVSFELFERRGQTRLRLTHRVTESFSDGIPEFSRKSCEEGWHYFIKERLKEYIESERFAAAFPSKN